jgi:hypothetical protein
MQAKIVERAEIAPAKCAVTGDIDGPFIDTGSWCPNADPYIYLHVPYVEEIATKLLGMVSKKEVAKLEAKVKDLTEQVEKFAVAEDALKALEGALAGSDE